MQCSAAARHTVQAHPTRPCTARRARRAAHCTEYSAVCGAAGTCASAARLRCTACTRRHLLERTRRPAQHAARRHGAAAHAGASCAVAVRCTKLTAERSSECVLRRLAPSMSGYGDNSLVQGTRELSPLLDRRTDANATQLGHDCVSVQRPAFDDRTPFSSTTKGGTAEWSTLH